MSPVVILLAAAFTGATSTSLGLLLLRRFGPRLRAGEVFPLAFLVGSAALSLTVFLTLTLWIARPWVFATLGIGAIAACVLMRAWRIPTDPSPDLPGRWKAMFAAALLFYGVYTFIYALAPETSPDGSAYHLGVVGRYFRNGGFDWYTTNMYANLPMGVEMLFLFAYSFGRHSAAALTHWQFLFVLPFLLLAIGRRFASPKAGAIAGLIAFLTPVILLDGACAYVDVGAAAVITGMFLALVAYEQESATRKWLPVVGILAGFAYGCKMTLAPAVVFAFLYILFVMWRQRAWSWKGLLTAAAFTAALAAPWPVKNAVLVGNPFSPFLNRYFPNPYIRISFEEDYRAQYRTYYGQVTDPKIIPLEVTVRGAILNGYLGPLFLIAPLGLLALRWPLGRRAWLAALVLSLSYPSNIGTRFLIAVVPFIALAFGLLFERWRMGTAVVAFQLLAAWPGAGEAYAHPFAWRLDKFRWAQAWRIESEDNFLSRMMPAYRMSKMVELTVPPDGRVFTYNGVAEAYTSREVDVAYQAGRNNAVGEILAAGIATDLPAVRASVFRFAPVQAKRVRLVQTATTPQIWSVSEMRVLSPAGREYPREQWWRLRASPNPWDVQWAFDNCPVTRWKAWEASKPGEYLEVDFVRPVELGGIRAEMSADQPNTAMRVEIDAGDGRWTPVSAEPEVEALEIPPNVRRIVTDDMKRLGYTHLVVEKSEFLAPDIYRNESAWGVTRIGDTGDARLYKLD